MTATADLKRTPLYECHREAGAKLVPFAGWEMPVQYEGVIEEHRAVRTAAGLFDVSHMGQVFVEGSGAEAFLDSLTPNWVAKLPLGRAHYSGLLTERGTYVDDLLIYRLAAERFLVVVNASNAARDFEWIASRAPQGVSVTDASDDYALIAVQGPRAVEILAPLCAPDIRPIRYYGFAEGTVAGIPAILSRTGYTGEDGFEIIAPADQIESIWDQLLAAGHAHCLQPAGLGARDTLRTEMCYPLYGHELDENTTPIEAGVGFFVALDKGEFIGRSVLAAQKAEGPKKRCVAFKMTGKSAPPRPSYPIWSTGPDAAAVGLVVSGTQSPSLNQGIGLGYVPPTLATPGTTLEIEIRGRRFPAVVVKKPIYAKG